MVERINDLIMKQGRDGKLFALWAVANQEYIDYSMPVRVMLQEALEYDKQVKEIRSRNNNSDKWEGAERLHDIIDFGEDAELAEQMRALTPIYPLHFLNLSEQKDSQCFKSELKTLFALYARRNDKEEFKAYLNTHEECKRIDEETCQAFGILTGSARLSSMMFRNNKDEEEFDMCRAIEELIEEGKADGRAIGIAEGITAMVAGMKKLHISSQQICEVIMEQCGMTKEQAQKYI